MSHPLSPEARRCPVCKDALASKPLRGIPIDVCERHGIWLDRGELEELLEKQKRTQRVLTARAVKQARREGAYAGWFFDWIALLFPQSCSRLFEETEE